MNKTYLELANIIGDLNRSVIYYAVDSEKPNAKNCTFIQNIIKNFPKLKKIDPNISKIIDIKYLKSDADQPKVKAEFLLMQSLKLQHYLGF